MDRRDFLKTGALLSSAAALAPVSAKAAEQKKLATDSIAVKGYVKEPARKIPLVDSADVVIIGGGPAGFAAAFSAARNGVDVLMLEREYFLGGLFTGCGVTPIIDYYTPTSAGRTKVIAGVLDDFCTRLDKVGMMCLDGIKPKADPEAAKYFMEEMIAESGARMLYGVHAVQVACSGDAINTVFIEGKSGRAAIAAKFVIDCSGDGDVLEWTGEDFTVYKNEIGAMWRIGHAENTKYKDSPVKGVKTMWARGDMEQDGLDMYNLTRIQRKLRKSMWDQAMKLRKKPGCEDLFLLDSPSVVGVRLTRVLNSVQNVSADGAVHGKVYDDVVGITGADSSVTVGGTEYKRKTRSPWQIPLSSLTPKKVQNLFVAGRCFGFEEPIKYDAREVGTCFVTGQAAGTAAAQAVLQRRSCRDIDIKALQETLRKDGVSFNV